MPSSALRFRPAASGTSQGQEPPPAGREARVWVLRDGQIQPVPVTPGLTDGATTAIVAGNLAENAQVVTGTRQAAAAPQATSPLLPFTGRRGGGAGGNAGRQGTGAGRGGV